MRLPLTVAAAMFSSLAATPAAATGGIYCDGVQDSSVAAELTVPRVPGFAVVAATFSTEDATWSTLPERGTEITLAQAAVIGALIVADFADPNAMEIVVSLRLVRGDPALSSEAAGMLSIPGHGEWPVTCVLE